MFSANFRNEEYYKKSMQLLRHYRPAVETLGEPIRSVKLDLADTDNNRSDGLTAKVTPMVSSMILARMLLVANLVDTE